MKYSDINCKEVINIRDGTLVGVVKDMGFDAFTYEIHSIFVHPACSFVKRILPWFFP
ncbi:MAG: PRC-barrel domain-containing protein, partial [Longicatena sp.]